MSDTFEQWNLKAECQQRYTLAREEKPPHSVGVHSDGPYRESWKRRRRPVVTELTPAQARWLQQHPEFVVIDAASDRARMRQRRAALKARRGLAESTGQLVQG
jgi:hypothetical protein